MTTLPPQPPSPPLPSRQSSSHVKLKEKTWQFPFPNTAWLCGRWLVGILGLRVRIPWGHECLSVVLCVVRQRLLRLAYHSARAVLPNLVCLSMIIKPRWRGGPGPLGAVASLKKKSQNYLFASMQTIFSSKPYLCWA